MAGRASGISGLVSGISVNVKHISQKEKEQGSGKRELKERKVTGKQYQLDMTQKSVRTFLDVIKTIHKWTFLVV